MQDVRSNQQAHSRNAAGSANSPVNTTVFTPMPKRASSTGTQPRNSGGFEAEKQNCINAGKQWTGSSCDYSVGNNVKHIGYAFTCDSPNLTEAYEGQCQKQGEKAQAATAMKNTPLQSNNNEINPGDSEGGSNSARDYNGFGESTISTEVRKKAWAYCWGTKSGSFICDGPLNKLLVGEKTLNRALEMTDCPNGKHINGNWYDCGRPLKWTTFHKERDVRALRE